MKAEWKGRAEFAEFAEALGIETDKVMAVDTNGTVMWTEDHGDGEYVWSGVWGRTPDGILIVGQKNRLMTTEVFVGEMSRLLARARLIGEEE